jgi:hypothetical protein
MHLSVSIQTSAEPVPAVPPWFGEVAVIAQYLGHVGLLATIEERVRFARRRFGHYDLVDFVVVSASLRHQRRADARSVL